MAVRPRFQEPQHEQDPRSDLTMVSHFAGFDVTNLSTTYELVTPTLAEEWLKSASQIRDDGRPLQRPLTSETVMRYAELMEAGEWYLSPEPIIMCHHPDAVGEIVADGQHRLHAVVLSEVTVPFTITRGWPWDIFHYLNKGKKRSIAHTLYAENTPNYGAVANAGAVLYKILQEPNAYRWRSVRYHEFQVLNLLKDHPGLAQDVSWATSLPANFVKSVFAVARYLTLSQPGQDREGTEAWFDSIKTGAGLLTDSPALTLRNHLIRMRDQNVPHGVDKGPFVMYLIQRAWERHVKGQEYKKVMYREGDIKVTATPPVLRKREGS